MRCDLPRDAATEAIDAPRCPWCGAQAGDAKVSLEALAFAFNDRSLFQVGRAPDGSTEGNALTLDCPDCARPFAVALSQRVNGRFVRCIAVRTEADRRMLRGEHG